jgi:hypothetical protein
MAFAFEQLRACSEIVEVALDAFASASTRRRSANAVYCASAQSTASSCDTPLGPASTGSSLSRRNLSSAADQSAILMSLRRYARNSGRGLRGRARPAALAETSRAASSCGGRRRTV